MELFRSFPSINQYSGFVKYIRDNCNYHKIPLPTITFRGSVKLHGTNAAIGYDPVTKDIWFQSRERILTLESDNAGFCLWGNHNKDALKKMLDAFLEAHSQYVGETDFLYVYGEWFGGSIAKGVALNQLKEKKFGIFDVVLADSTDITNEQKNKNFDPVVMVDHITQNQILVIDDLVPPIILSIDFSRPDEVQNKLLELTLDVEAECPVGKALGVIGIGEGLVWSVKHGAHKMKFKTKGPKHSASKVKVLKELTSAEIEAKESAREFVDFACTENRLEQGVSKLGEMGFDVKIENMGAFLKFISTDILKELSDVLVASNIDRKVAMPFVNQKAKDWFIAYLMKDVGLDAQLF